jgi:hypothetical protein
MQWMSQAAANATWEKVLGVRVVDAFIGKTYQRQPNVAKAQQPLKIEGATLHVCEDGRCCTQDWKVQN